MKVIKRQKWKEYKNKNSAGVGVAWYVDGCSLILGNVASQLRRPHIQSSSCLSLSLSLSLLFSSNSSFQISKHSNQQVRSYHFPSVSWFSILSSYFIDGRSNLNYTDIFVYKFDWVWFLGIPWSDLWLMYA